jgi:triosephosphate isomerase
MKRPVLFVNFKAYAEASGNNALSMAMLCQDVSKETGAEIVPVVQALDLRLVVSGVKLPVFAQHVDAVSFGANTGKILPEAVKLAGATGSVINHAEFKQSNEVIEKAIGLCRSNGLLVMACAESLERAKQLAVFSPDFIAVEPPELIGGNVSVSTARPELVSDCVEAIKSVNSKVEVITGAGIKNAKDVSKAIELGTKGVFVASGIIKAADKKAALLDLVSGFG